MDNLGSYHSKYTGEEIDAAVLAVLANLVTSFNGRPGPIIQSEVGDYSADMIAVPNLLSSSGEILTNLLDTLVDIRDNMTKYEEVSLYSDYEVSSQGNGYIFDLSESFMHFDTLRLEFIPTYSEGVTSRYNSFFISTDTLKKMMATGKATGTNSFIIEITNPSAYAYIFPLSEVQLKIVTKYKDSYIVVRDIFGINYAKKVFEKSGDIE